MAKRKQSKPKAMHISVVSENGQFSPVPARTLLKEWAYRTDTMVPPNWEPDLDSIVMDGMSREPKGDWLKQSEPSEIVAAYINLLAARESENLEQAALAGFHIGCAYQRILLSEAEPLAQKAKKFTTKKSEPRGAVKASLAKKAKLTEAKVKRGAKQALELIAADVSKTEAWDRAYRGLMGKKKLKRTCGAVLQKAWADLQEK